MRVTECQGCGRTLSPSKGGRPRKWCSENCRKRTWENTVYRHPCLECGTEIYRRSERCIECQRARFDRLRFQRWTRIAALWATGIPAQQIAERIGWKSAGALSVEIDRMKKAGWDIPPRRAGWRGNYRAVGPPKVEPQTREQINKRLHHAIRTGKLIRPNECERCGAIGYVDGHHEDYSRPLYVIWLCKPCHIEHHGKVAA